MNAGSQPSFVDTNVLVYAVADDDPVRRLVAQTLVDTLAAAQALHTSTQVLQELYVVLTRKVRRKFTSAEAIDYLDRIARAPVTTTDYRLVRQAAELSDRDAFSFWNALVLHSRSMTGQKGNCSATWRWEPPQSEKRIPCSALKSTIFSRAWKEP